LTQSIEEKVLTRIRSRGRGWSFSQKDFGELGSRDAIDQAFTRLTEKSTIRRVIRGIYDYPRHSDLLSKDLSPDVHQVAHALARKFGWRIQPSGAAAQNLVGLSTQVPSQYVYQSDGPDRTYEIGKTKLEFRKTALKEAGFKHDESALLVQVLKSLGNDHITNETIKHLRDWLPADKRSKVLKDTKAVTDWVYAAVKRICREEADG
jgi:hypothetical protein